MDLYFFIKLVVLFIVGGGSMAIISLIAEKSGKKISGVIISFPSTVVITFIFLAYTNSIEVVTKVAPATFIPLGVGLLFPIIYINFGYLLSKFHIPKIFEIAGSFFISTIFWLIFSIPMAMINFSNMWIGVLIYLILVVLTQFILEKEKHERPIPMEYSNKEKIGRAIFIGFMLVFIAVISKVINPFWGSVFSVFPAGVGSLLMILHWNYSPHNLFPIIQKLPIGSLLVCIYVISVIYFFPVLGPILGTIVSYAISLALYLAIRKIIKD